MLFTKIKKFLVGQPLRSEDIHEEKLPKWKALAVFSSDALSSVAYATQEVLIPLSIVSVSLLVWSMPIAFVITCLLIIVMISYWQTIRCYPKGGGAYLVSKENLGTTAGLITAASLLIDYILTVSVSVAAGVEAITSAVPFLFEHRVALGVLAICIVTLVNLRGMKESGSIFALPTYLFIVSIFTLIIVGIYKVSTGAVVEKATVLHETYPYITWFLLLKAFSAGCTALTGIEAISDGVSAFRKPEARNAQLTLLAMACILGFMFLSLTGLAHIFLIVPSETETVISQIARTVLGTGFFYYLIQIATALILLLAANTSFADFPRVCSFLAIDRFLPRQLASLGDRLVYSKGIFVLGFFSCALLIFFQGKTHYLIPLYAVGVFISFTLSQIGMVRHHFKKREKGWQYSAAINSFGALCTFCVLSVIAITKFAHGAWIVIMLIPLMVSWFRMTREHYRKAAAQLSITDDIDFVKPIKHVVVLPISGIHKGVIDAIKYAKSISNDVRAVYVELDESSTERLKPVWDKMNTGIPLTVLKSPYRSIIQPILKYIRDVDKEEEDDMLTVVIPEFVTARWWEGIYHNQTAFLIRTALLFEKGKVVTSVRYHLSR